MPVIPKPADYDVWLNATPDQARALYKSLPGRRYESRTHAAAAREAFTNPDAPCDLRFSQWTAGAIL